MAIEAERTHLNPSCLGNWCELIFGRIRLVNNLYGAEAGFYSNGRRVEVNPLVFFSGK